MKVNVMRKQRLVNLSEHCCCYCKEHASLCKISSSKIL